MRIDSHRLSVDPEVKGTKQGKELRGFFDEVLDTSSWLSHLGERFPISHKFLERQGLSLTAIMTPVLGTDRQAWLLRGKAGPSRSFQESNTKYAL